MSIVFSPTSLWKNIKRIVNTDILLYQVVSNKLVYSSKHHLLESDVVVCRAVGSGENAVLVIRGIIPETPYTETILDNNLSDTSKIHDYDDDTYIVPGSDVPHPGELELLKYDLGSIKNVVLRFKSEGGTDIRWRIYTSTDDSTYTLYEEVGTANTIFLISGARYIKIVAYNKSSDAYLSNNWKLYTVEFYNRSVLQPLPYNKEIKISSNHYKYIDVWKDGTNNIGVSLYIVRGQVN